MPGIPNAIGSACASVTTANALVPGFVKFGQAADHRVGSDESVRRRRRRERGDQRQQCCSRSRGFSTRNTGQTREEALVRGRPQGKGRVMGAMPGSVLRFVRLRSPRLRQALQSSCHRAAPPLRLTRGQRQDRFARCSFDELEPDVCTDCEIWTMNPDGSNERISMRRTDPVQARLQRVLVAGRDQDRFRRATRDAPAGHDIYLYERRRLQASLTLGSPTTRQTTRCAPPGRPTAPSSSFATSDGSALDPEDIHMRTWTGPSVTF